jgi:hypothetical protein
LWTPDDLENRPRFSIPHEVLETTTVEERIDFMWHFFKAIDLYFFIYAYASKKYSLGRFADFEQECWYTCKRHQPHDRIAMKADCQTLLKPKSISQLEGDLKNILNIK